jgi:hypothetical protein
VPVTGVKKLIGGKPEVVNLKSNVFPAKPTQIIPAGPPSLVIPNGASYKPPQVVVAVDSPFIAGPPETILLKELLIKENNPESFSSIYLRQRAVDTNLDGNRTGTAWLTQGKGLVEQDIITNGKGKGNAEFQRCCYAGHRSDLRYSFPGD